MTGSLSILWFRRDLRLHDHAALAHALNVPHSVQPVFIFDTDILARFTDMHDRRLSFIADALMRLDAQLRQKGGGLLVLAGKPQEVMPKLAQVLGAARIFAAEDYEPATRARDKAIGNAAPLTLVKDQLVCAPGEILRDGQPYKVYTPYAKAWRARLAPTSFAPYAYQDDGRYADANHSADAARAAGLKVLEVNAAAMLEAVGYRHVSTGEWRVDDAPERLQTFVDEKVNAYGVQRDMVADDGTSKISPYLRFGLVSARECYRRAAEARASDKWISELIWREFYAMILYHFPESATQEWNPKYRGAIPWRSDASLFEAWKEGRTGYPLVDAAMRQLLSTGWMHNRARMVVASFLTKHLLMDWRLGEEHFAQHLMDYDMASNVGGWQWAASTGTDAQPYFRVFNPMLQSKKFDPDGEYIRRWVPELRDVNGDEIHLPFPVMRPKGYPAPIVDHAAARARAIAAFKAEREAD